MLLTQQPAGANGGDVDCSSDPVTSLASMFVNMVQKGRIDAGQCPAMRPVFLKPHGVVHGTFRVRPDLSPELAIGLFQPGADFPLWMRSSSDAFPTVNDFRTTVGLGLKLFNTPTPKLIGTPDDTTFDFIFQNMDVFFVDTARDMCEFTKAGVVDHDYKKYLDAHQKTADILKTMEKSVGSVLASPYWSIVPFALGPDQYVKYKLEPVLQDVPPSVSPTDSTYLATDLKKRLGEGCASFRFMVQKRTDPDTMPLDAATVAWSEDISPFVHVADVELPQQDVDALGQQAYGENLSWNIWRVTADHAPQGSIAEARRMVYYLAAENRRHANGVPGDEPNHAWVPPTT